MFGTNLLGIFLFLLFHLILLQIQLFRFLSHGTNETFHLFLLVIDSVDARNKDGRTIREPVIVDYFINDVDYDLQFFPSPWNIIQQKDSKHVIASQGEKLPFFHLNKILFNLPIVYHKRFFLPPFLNNPWD